MRFVCAGKYVYGNVIIHFAKVSFNSTMFWNFLFRGQQIDLVQHSFIHRIQAVGGTACAIRFIRVVLYSHCFAYAITLALPIFSVLHIQKYTSIHKSRTYIYDICIHIRMYKCMNYLYRDKSLLIKRLRLCDFTSIETYVFGYLRSKTYVLMYTSHEYRQREKLYFLTARAV